MVHKTVLKVDISDERWKKKILKAVSGIPGVDIVQTDAAKGTLTVTGAADPYEVILRTKKTGKFVEVVSIGPPPAPPKPQEQKKPDEKGKPLEKKLDEKKPDSKAQDQPQLQLQLLPPQPLPLTQSQPYYPPAPYMGQTFHPSYISHQNYPMCDRVSVVYLARQDEPNPSCTIM